VLVELDVDNEDDSIERPAHWDVGGIYPTTRETNLRKCSSAQKAESREHRDVAISNKE